MHSLSQQQTSPVPIMQNKFSQDTGLQGYPGSVQHSPTMPDIALSISTDSAAF
jgi:hypothetical protein